MAGLGEGGERSYHPEGSMPQAHLSAVEDTSAGVHGAHRCLCLLGSWPYADKSERTGGCIVPSIHAVGVLSVPAPQEAVQI